MNGSSNGKDFWKEVWHYFEIISSTPYDQVFVKTGDGFLDNEWFRGAAFNLAENIMRIRDSRIGLICCDEFGNRETITYNEIYEQTKLYAAAFRKHGLKVGDRVAYYISNIKESLFAMLATISIGAIWGGPFTLSWTQNSIKYYEGSRSKIYHFSGSFSQACGAALSNRKFVSYSKSILLDDFLQSGMTADGVVPDLIFEQLPFNHPTIINFTSGTTGTQRGWFTQLE
ncbi:acetoacetyl-CoA synthetase [Caerostris extrusa]|uniref:Acetoacetyl-CoA synthetase n=1 Tax=Caerostris extrusa TaxID=172846 RepID=A0AAV4PKI9_CAEEX|nr:acetoacetyl-CoA synthetase [Caerostris extrusa]